MSTEWKTRDSGLRERNSAVGADIIWKPLSLTPRRAGSGSLAGTSASADTCSTSFIRPSVGRPQTHLGVPSGLASGGRQLALNSAFVQGSQVGRGRADPLPPLECRLAAPPSSPSFSAASPTHFLSPTDPTTKRAHTHTHTHTSWRARRPRSRLRDPGHRGLGE